MAGWADVTRFAHDNTHHVTVRKSCYPATRRSAKGSPMRSGGKREGAGRKVSHGERKETTTVRLTPTLREFLARDGESIGDQVETIVRKTRAFREWMKTRD